MSRLIELAERVERGVISSNELDVLVEIALFEPDEFWTSVRANNAGTKVIYTTKDGREHTYLAADWTDTPEETAAALRARAAKETDHAD